MTSLLRYSSLAKSRLFLVVFLLTGFSVFAQTYREAKIFIPPIEGTGTPEENIFFYKQLTYEVVLQYNSLVRSRFGSDFTLKGIIEPYLGEELLTIEDPKVEDVVNNVDIVVLPASPVPPRPIPRIRNTLGRREFFSWEVEGNILFFDTTGEGNYEPEVKREVIVIEEPEPVPEPVYEEIIYDSNEKVFILELIESLTGEVVARQYLIYGTVDDSVSELVSVIVYYMLAGTPDIVQIDDWRYNWLFVNVSGLWAPRIYVDKDQIFNLVNFGLSVSAEYHFTDFAAVELGLQLAQDRVTVSSSDDEYRDLILEIPVALKFILKPLNNLMLEPYLGGSFNLSLMGTTRPFIFSWFAGLQLGVKTGPGMIIIDPRFSMDFNKSVIPENKAEYHRIMMQVGIGYKFGFFPKYTRTRDF